jgi:8-oxo-dGTP diphosphatase
VNRPRPRGDRASVFIVRDGSLLLFRRHKYGEDYYSLPGGTVEPGETPEIAAVREMREETGLEVVVSEPVLEVANEGRREFYYDALEAEGEPELGGPEAERNSPENSYDLEWVPLAELDRYPLRPPALARWLAARDWPAGS